MHTFIDESGTFQILDKKEPHVCCVAALVVPSSRVDGLLADFVATRELWPAGQREVKGSRLDEAQVASAIDVAVKARYSFKNLRCRRGPSQHPASPLSANRPS